MQSQAMSEAFAPLSRRELDQLHHFLIYRVDTEEVITMDIVDGFMRTIAIGPTKV